ncbi:EAL domain-containing protein [Cohaesibacter intestini]|uniref:EAL domain-containing protein n=1 Tax=Cohaesibacter intestini TaxID=2211145 RepID=UPI0018E4EE16|nr:EAL domain-containing protein [Cohaesibacter intestini]
MTANKKWVFAVTTRTQTSEIVASKARTRFFALSTLPAFFAALVVVVATFVAEDVSREFEHNDMRRYLQQKTNLIGSRLQGRITANVELVRGLAATIATDSDIDQERFTALANSLDNARSDIQSFAVAPDLVVSMVHPLEGNEAVLGLDYRTNEAQRAMALQARDTKETIFAGPVDLVQGGRGFIARYPIFNRLPNGREQFWGLLAAVIDADTLLKLSGIVDNTEVDFALVGRDGRGFAGNQFFGDAKILENDPVSNFIDFGSGQWILYAIPKGGWATTSKNVWFIRAVGLCIFFLVVVPIYGIGRLYQERGVHLADNLANQQKLAHMTKRLEMALQSSKIGVWEFDPALEKTHWDERMKELHGLPLHEDVTDQFWRDRLHPDDRDRVIEEIRVAVENGTLFKSQFRIRPAGGKELTIRAVGSLLVSASGERRLIGVNWDISEDVAREHELEEARAESERRYLALEQAQVKIRESALHDFLTGLPNRRYLDDLLHRRNGDGPCIDDQSCLIKIDLDGFKEVNDNYGHAAGDAILVEVASLLRRVISEEEFTARVGGDEFIILCQTDEELERPVALCGEVLEALQTPIEFNGRKCRIGASIGIALSVDAKNDPDKLLSNADLALYQSKQTGKGRYSFFSEPLVQKARQQRRLADDVLRGIENREFIAFYQGQYSAKTHELVGAEALARWQHPERGLVSPFEFVETAEALGVMGAIDAQILDHVIATKKRFDQQGFVVPRLSVNVSAKRLGDKDLIGNLRKLDINPESLTFELVESTFLDRSDAQVAANIRQIRDMGIDIEIDDFGTAYASIVSLTHLLPNRLKIDRELVLPIIEREDQRELVHSIIHIGRTLGIGSVAEGVESMEHAEILRIMGVDILQGFAFCRPLSAEDFYRHHHTSTGSKAWRVAAT